MNSKHLLIIWFGSVISWKYMRFIKEYIDSWIIEWYSIIDIESQRSNIENKISSILIKPIEQFFISDTNTGKDINNINEFESIIKYININKNFLKVFISTDPRFHEWYLEYCLNNNIDCLVEKPIITPIDNDNKFNPYLYESKMDKLLNIAKTKKWNFSVMSWARYHEIFNWDILDNIESKMNTYKVPITSFHIRTSSWVWNLYNEFSEREDHPYKYWFWVINHWAYHYIDVLAQCLNLNKKLLDDDLELTINSFVAYPIDQSVRIPSVAYENFNWKIDNNLCNTDNLKYYWETDIVTNFSLKTSKNKVITLWTISLEHTTPCCRDWAELDFSEYNKNWRLPCTDVEVQLSTLYSVHSHMFKKPENYIKYYAETLFRSNKNLINEDKYYEKKVYPDFESRGKFKLIQNWLEWKEEKSKLEMHSLTMKLIEKLSISILTPWESISFKV